VFDNVAFDHLFGEFAARPVGDGAVRIFGRFASDGIELCDLFGCVFSPFAVVGIVGENNIDDKIVQGFFVPLLFDGSKLFGLLVPTVPPSADGFNAQTDLRSDLLVVVCIGGK